MPTSPLAAGRPNFSIHPRLRLPSRSPRLPSAWKSDRQLDWLIGRFLRALGSRQSRYVHPSRVAKPWYLPLTRRRRPNGIPLFGCNRCSIQSRPRVRAGRRAERVYRYIGARRDGERGERGTYRIFLLSFSPFPPSSPPLRLENLFRGAIWVSRPLKTRFTRHEEGTPERSAELLRRDARASRAYF